MRYVSGQQSQEWRCILTLHFIQHPAANTAMHIYIGNTYRTQHGLCVLQEKNAPLPCLVCYKSSMIKVPLNADKRSVCLSLVLFFIISKETAAMTWIRLWQIHSTPLWLVVNQEVKSHRSNFTMRPGRSRAPDNTTCWNSGGRKSWDTNPWTNTYRHLKRCTGKQKIVSLLSMWMWSSNLSYQLHTPSILFFQPRTIRLNCSKSKTTPKRWRKT